MLDELLEHATDLTRSAPEDERPLWRSVVKKLRKIAERRYASALEIAERHRDKLVAVEFAAQLLRTTASEIELLLEEAGEVVPVLRAESPSGKRATVRFRMGALLDYLAAKPVVEAAPRARGKVSPRG